MRIATFNVNSVRSRTALVVEWLRANQPDILALQETKVADELFPAAAFAEAGYHVAFRGEGGYNGVALASRQEPDEVSFGLDDGEQADETRLVLARFGRLSVLNTYVPQGREITHAMYPYKLQWFARLRKYFDRHFTVRSRVVWVGDLNVAPLPIDIHNAEKQANHVCYHAAAREAFSQAMKWGFVDVFRKHHPEPGQYTFFDYRIPSNVQRNLGWRVDHILATPVFAKTSTNAWIDLTPRLARNASDHTVLAADFAD